MPVNGSISSVLTRSGRQIRPTAGCVEIVSRFKYFSEEGTPATASNGSKPNQGRDAVMRFASTELLSAQVIPQEGMEIMVGGSVSIKRQEDLPQLNGALGSIFRALRSLTGGQFN